MQQTELRDVQDVRSKLDSQLRQAVEMAAHEIAIKIHNRYCEVREGNLPLDEEAIAITVYQHIRAVGYAEIGSSILNI